MEAAVAMELEALRAEVAALKDMAANWRVNGLDKLVQGRGATAQLGASATSGNRTLRTGNWRASVADMYETPGTSVEIFDIYYQAPPEGAAANSYDKYAYLRGQSAASGGQTNLTMGCNEQLLASPSLMKTLIEQIVGAATCTVTLDAEYGTGISQNSLKLVFNAVANTIAFTGPKVKMDSLALNGVAADPAVYLANGDVWYRSDTNQFGFRINGVTYYMSAATFTTLATDTLWDAKGDLAVGTGADTAARLAVGANTTILMADSTQATGVKWQATPGTRYCDLYWDSIGAATKAADAHGSLGSYGTHIDMADATDYTLDFAPVSYPRDFSGAMTLELLMSAAAANGNYVFDVVAIESASPYAGQTTLLSSITTVKANAAAANTHVLLSFAFGTQPFLTTGRINVQVVMRGANASDTVNAQRTLWLARLAYTPTL